MVEIRAWSDGPVGSPNDTGTFLTVNVDVTNPCENPSTFSITTPSSPLASQVYYIGGGATSYNVQDISSPDGGVTDGFSVSLSICGSLIFDALVYLDYEHIAKGDVGPVSTASTQGLLKFSQTTAIVTA